MVSPTVRSTRGGPAPGWHLSVYPEAGEAGGSFRSTIEASRERGRRGGGDRERSRVEAARRARSKLRRYCSANRLNKLGTLTYAGAGCHDPAAFRSDIADFFGTLRGRLGGEPFPYAWVPEWHPGGHGLHAHFAVAQYIHRSKIRDAWGRGHIKIKLLGNLPVGSGHREEARVAARYLSKYIGKDFDGHELGLHRYDVAEGFQPRKVAVWGRSPSAALDAACEIMAAAPVYVWDSSEAEGWQGPPTVWASWR